MKKQHLLSIAFAAALGVIAAPAAMASDGTINFAGKLVDSTCAFTVGGTTTVAGAQGSGTVTLPTLSINALPSPNSVAGLTWFTMTPVNGTGTCTAPAGLFAGFEASGLTTAAGRILSGDSNVDFQLVNADSTVIVPGNVTTIQGNTDATTPITYGVQYYANTAATSGDAQALTGSVTYSVIYK